MIVNQNEYNTPLTFVERRDLPVRLVDVLGVPVTGVTYNAAGMVVEYQPPSSDAWIAVTLRAQSWLELGYGDYLLRFYGTAVADRDPFKRTGTLRVRVKCAATRGDVFEYHLVPDRVLRVPDLESVTRQRPWRLSYNSPVLDVAELTAQGGPADFSAKFKSVWLDGSTYRAWFVGRPVGGSEALYHATSTDGLTWTYDAAAGAVFTYLPSPSWEGGACGMNTIWLEGTTWHMLYRGGASTLASPECVGHATSPDGYTWTRDSANPVLCGSSVTTDWNYFGIENGAGVAKYTYGGQTLYYIYPNHSLGPFAQNVTAGGFTRWGTRQIGCATAPAPGGPWTWQPGPLFGDGCFSGFPFSVDWSGQTRYYLLMTHYQVGIDKSQHEIWSSSSPLFPANDRHLERVINTADWGFNALDNDTICLLTTDVTRSAFPNNEILAYFTGANDPVETPSGNRTGILYAGGRNTTAGSLGRLYTEVMGRRNTVAGMVWGDGAEALSPSAHGATALLGVPVRSITRWPGGPATITITVRDGGGAAIPGCRIVLRDSTGGLLMDASAGTTGTLVVNLDVAVGYTITAGPVAGFSFTNPTTFAVESTAAATVSVTGATISTLEAPSGVLGMTFEDIQASVDLHLQRAYGDDARYVTETLRDQWINAAYHQIDMALEWTRSTYGFTTTANVEGYTVPDYVRYIDIVSMVDANDKLTQLREINHQEYIQKCIATTSAGIPQFYLRRGGEIILYPMPDAATYDVTLYIITDAADLSNASDIPPWPVHTHQYIVDMVLAYAGRYFGQPEKAVQYRQYVKECIREEMREPAADRSEPQRIVNTMF